MRLDKYLKVSRLIKRRTVANEACDAERVSVNGRPARASYEVKVGDVIEIRFGERVLKVRVAAVTENATKDAAAKTGRAVGEHAGNFFSGVGEGIERAIVAYDVDLSDPSLAPLGASVNIVRHISEYNSETRKDDEFLLLYFLNQSPAEGTLRLVLRAADTREIGRSELPVALPADSATYLRFPLSRDLSTELVRSVSISLLPPAP